MLKDLCAKYTDLTIKDVQQIEDIARNLHVMADLAKADIFIVCPMQEGNATVIVGEYKPSICSSIYNKSILGKINRTPEQSTEYKIIISGEPESNIKILENKIIQQQGIPVKNRQGKVIGALIMEQEPVNNIEFAKKKEILAITADKLIETLLSYNDKANVAIHHVNDAIILFDEVEVAVYANPGADNLFRKLELCNSVVGHSLEKLTINRSIYERIRKGESYGVAEITFNKMSLQLQFAVLDVGTILLIKDITKVIETEKELILKSVAIKEIHHRVKNNLQMIGSILRLQCNRTSDELIKIAFSENISRILSIAVTHEILAQNGIDEIGVKTLTTRIKDCAIKYAIPPFKSIRMIIKGDEFPISSDVAIAIAVVVNELLTNSLQHAFEGRNKGYIMINIIKDKVFSTISITDNGVGFDLTKEKGLGLTIVNTLIKEKLLGNLHIESDAEGTRIVFSFRT